MESKIKAPQGLPGTGDPSAPGPAVGLADGSFWLTHSIAGLPLAQEGTCERPASTTAAQHAPNDESTFRPCAIEDLQAISGVVDRRAGPLIFLKLTAREDMHC